MLVDHPRVGVAESLLPDKYKAPDVSPALRNPLKFGAGEAIRTLDPNLGKVVSSFHFGRCNQPILSAQINRGMWDFCVG